MTFNELLTYIKYSFSSLFQRGNSNNDYYESFIHEKTLTELHDLMYQLPQDRISTEANVRFQGLPFGISPFKTRLSLGKPKKTLSFQWTHIRHAIDSYTLKGNKNYIINSHFLNNQLFYIHTCIRFPHVSTVKKINHLFENKFGISLEHFKSGFALLNPLNEALIYKPGLNIDIYHISLNDSFSKLLEKEFNDQQSAKATSEADELNELSILI